MTQVWPQPNPNYPNETNITFTDHPTTQPQMTLDPGMRPLTTLKHEGSHAASTTQARFQLNFNCPMKQWDQLYTYSPSHNLSSDDPRPWHVTPDLTNARRPQCCNHDPRLAPIEHQPSIPLTTFWNLKTWPQTTFDIDMWPRPPHNYEGSHALSTTQARLQPNPNFMRNWNPLELAKSSTLTAHSGKSDHHVSYLDSRRHKKPHTTPESALPKCFFIAILKVLMLAIPWIASGSLFQSWIPLKKKVDAAIPLTRGTTKLCLQPLVWYWWNWENLTKWSER